MPSGVIFDRFIGPVIACISTVRTRATIAAFALGILVGGNQRFFALDPPLQVSQYAHTAWTLREGFSVGNIFDIAQTEDGYLWFGGESGLFRFDGINAIPWRPPGLLPSERFAFRLLGARDGKLWIGTFRGLYSWNGRALTRYPELDGKVVGALLEDREGTIWAGTWTSRPARLCAIGDTVRCYDDDSFGKTVGGMREDSSGIVWAITETGLWRCKPGPPAQIAKTLLDPSALSEAKDGQLVMAAYGKSVLRFDGKKIQTLFLPSPDKANRSLREREVDANKLLSDRNGGLWIGTVARGLIHMHNGKTDVFTRADGLSGDIVLCLFEDREGNIWVSTTGGIDRFRELPVATMSVREGLASDNTNSVLAAQDGSVWIATHDGLTRWQNGRMTTFREQSGLPHHRVQSLYEDVRHRIWAFTDRGLACFEDDRFVPANVRIPSHEVFSITGDQASNLWLSGTAGLSHLVGTRLVEQYPWSALGRKEQAKVLVADKGGVWLSYWSDGGVQYFKDGRVQMSINTTDGLGSGHVPGLRLDRSGALWAATEDGGLSRIKDGRINTLTKKNGLPCDTVHWSTEADDGALWLYGGCGVVRVGRADIDAWIADPVRSVQTTIWDAADGVRRRQIAVSSFGPTVAKASDGRIWFLTGEGVAILDPRHLVENAIPPPVHIEKVVADHKSYWENQAESSNPKLRLPPHTHDLQIFYTALSLVAPEKVHFKYKLDGQDKDWREVVNDRDVQYSNLAPGAYRFHVIASNNSGIWNQQGQTIELIVDPAFTQTKLFRAVCAVLGGAFIWLIYQMRVRRLRHEFAVTLEARVGERTSIARELHDTLLQSFHGLMLRFQIVSELLPDRPIEAKEQLDKTMERAAEAITEGRDAVQGLRASTVQTNDLPQAISTLGEELAADPANCDSPEFRVTVEGRARDLHPIMRDEVYRIIAEALRNAFCHARARQVEAEIRYDDQQIRLRVRDDGKGIDPSILLGQGPQGHYGLAGMKERAKLIGAKLTVWSEVDAGTEVELQIPAAMAYSAASKRSWVADLLARR